MDSIHVLDCLLFDKIAKPARREGNLPERCLGIWRSILADECYCGARNYTGARHLFFIVLGRCFLLLVISGVFVDRVFLGKRHGGDFSRGA